MQNKITWFMLILTILYTLALVLDKLYPTSMVALNLMFFILTPMAMFGIAYGLWTTTLDMIEINRDYLFALHTAESKGYSKNLSILKDLKLLIRGGFIMIIAMYFIIAVIIWLIWSDI